MRYRANTAVLGVYLEILPDGKIRSGFFVDDLRELDNFQSVRMFTSAFHCLNFRISLLEMLKMPRCDAINHRKKLATCQSLCAH